MWAARPVPSQGDSQWWRKPWSLVILASRLIVLALFLTHTSQRRSWVRRGPSPSPCEAYRQPTVVASHTFISITLSMSRFLWMHRRCFVWGVG